MTVAGAADSRSRSSPHARAALAERLPGGRLASRLAGSAVLLCVLLVGWSALTEIDVVVTAPAVARSTAGTVEVRSPAVRTVARVLVEEGARVARGDPLMLLQSMVSRSEWRSAARALDNDRRALAEQRLALAVFDRADPDPAAAAISLAGAARLSRLAHLDGELLALETELVSARGTLSNARRLLNLVAERFLAVQRASRRGAISRFDLLAVRQEYWSRRAEMEAARGRATVLEQRLAAQHHARAATAVELRRELLDSVAALEVAVAEAQARLADAAHQLRQAAIVAPVAGVVNRMPVSGGQFVQRGEPLAVIVAVDAPVYFEARLAPAQMAFLHAGLPCRVKLDALPFARYGVLPCTLTLLGRDVVPAAQDAGHYLARVEPAAQELLADGDPIRLEPGATAWVDIVAGKRTVLGYVTEPLQRFARESLRER